VQKKRGGRPNGLPPEADPRFRVIFEQSPIGIILYDRDGRVTAINRSALEIFGVEDESAVRNIPLFREPNLPAGVAERLQAGESVPLTLSYDFDAVRAQEFYPTTKSGIIVLEGFFTPLGATGRHAGFLLQVQDITAATEDRRARENALREAERHRREQAGLLAGARAVLVNRDFRAAAREIFSTCKELLGAAAGYVALVSTDGRRNDLVAADVGGAGCGVDAGLAMPVHGLYERAYRSGAAVWENDFSPSGAPSRLPQGHVALENVLFAPLVIDGATLGMFGFANKAGGFGPPEAKLAAAFGELAAIALMNSRSQLQIERSLREKDVLLREIHHRVKNNLQVVTSLLTLQEERLRDEESRQVLRQLMDRIRSMSLIHERLLSAGDLACIRMQGYCTELLGHLMQSYGADPARIVAEVSAGDLELDIDTAVTCGLIVNELVSNSLKHAFRDGRAGAVSVRFERRAAGALALAVSDTGPGFPAAPPPEGHGTTGIQLVGVLCEQLGGRAELTGDAGMRFQVLFAPRG
jgi:PAS domain S-box-containing protein